MDRIDRLPLVRDVNAALESDLHTLCEQHWNER
jgi:hypothetical protein